jgi:hypothetical protein
MRPIRKTRNAILIAGAGALAAYFIDPESGEERRDRVMEQFRSMTGGMGPSEGDQMQGDQVVSSTGRSDVTSSGAAAAFIPPVGDGPIDLATGSPMTHTPDTGDLPPYP